MHPSNMKKSKKNGKNPTGAVMVVGGGIAGMQASLDLADQGFKVYLIETKSAIGGKMAQLDKTFPTNDCAMCTISPKLVETGRHPNIKIMTTTDVIGIDGEAGAFKVGLRHRPRYIDREKCVACNDCADVCPVTLPNQFNEGLDNQKAVYKLYPQATPNAYAIEKRGIAPCQDTCPASQKAQGYIALIKEGRWEDAYRTIKLDNPFPGICGRVCNHECETVCNRSLVDEPINIHGLKRFVVDKVMENPRQPIEAIPKKFKEKVAIIGAGPAGLTTAQDLAMEGYPVTVFEALPHAGGMLRFGIPEYKLPNEIIEREVEDILDLGVDLKLNKKIDDIDKLFDNGYKAVMVAVGAHDGIKLPIPGADLEDVIINTDFLRDMRLGKYHNGEAKPLGERVLVIGGGNVAIDCARLARRLGKEVHMACLESRDEMPAHAYEVDTAEQEGITVHNSLTFEQILSNEKGKITGVEASKVASFHFDDTGQLHLEKEHNSLHTLECDTVIFAVGQRVGLGFLDDTGIGQSKRRTIDVNPETFATSRPGIFSAGDTVTGTLWAINAIADGHKAAQSIIRYLRSEPLEPITKPDKPVVVFSQEEIDEKIENGEIIRQPRTPMPSLSMKESINNLKEIQLGYDEDAAKAEAARCLTCGVCSECMSCVFACQKDAINHDEVESTSEINVGAVILAPGYQVYNAELSEEFGLGRYPNVVTSLQYERMLSASGPTEGHIKRPSDNKNPRRIAFLQCIGSRDKKNDYCSSVCCMYAAKEAIMTIEHAQAEARSGNGSGEVKCQVFFMDTRSYSKGYEEYYQRAEKKYGVTYTRCRLSEVKEDPITNNLIVHYANPYEGAGEVIEEEFDLVVLSVGMEISESVKNLGHSMGIELDSYGFCHTTLFDPLQTSREGIYVAGPFREPKDIPETVIEASGAAAATARLLSSARYSLTQVKDYPAERDVKGIEERVGVFVCHCGSNIGGYLDVPQVAEYALTQPGVVHAEDNLYTCSQDSISHIIEQVKALDLNRVVVASCTPLTHEPLFQDAIRQAGLNPYLFEMANIRNQCSWVHPSDWDGATEKAKSLVRMAVSRAKKLEPIKTSEVPVNNTALIIGGGPAGMTAALTLADQGFPVHIIEREGKLGGNIHNLGYFVASTLSNGNGKTLSPKKYLSKTIKEIEQNELIEVHLNTELIGTGGFKGNFTSKLNQDGQEIEIQHGAIIVATGGMEYKGKEYGYGKDPRILTQLDFETLLAKNEKKKNALPNSVVMIQCIGPAEKFCSRLCCTTALKNALKLKELNPDADVTILYRDIRTYGFKERYYTQAREAGVRFVHYKFDQKPEVIIGEEGPTVPLQVRFLEPILGREVGLNPDLLVLSTPIIPSKGSKDLASRLKLSMDMDGFFLEAHVKLRPVDFAADGIFMAGVAHYPKFLDETIAQAQAAASRAASILSKKTMLTNARVAVVDPNKCVGCLTCVRICPYDVPKMKSDHTGVGNIVGTAYIESAICHGCGSCASECPAKAIQLMHYVDAQLIGKIDALFEQEPV